MSGHWKLAVGEVPLGALGPLDEAFLNGREITHSFLALIDDSGQVVEELHGRPLDGFASAFKDLKNSIRQYFNLYSAPPDQVVKTQNGAKLKVFLDKPECNKVPEKCVYTVVDEGSRADIEQKWEKAIERAIDISSADIDYLALGIGKNHGQNCHSVTCSILHHIGKNAQEIAECLTENYIRPGFERILPKRNLFANGEKPSKSVLRAQLKSTVKDKGKESLAPTIKRIATKLGIG